MGKLNKKLEELRDNYNNACNAYLDELIKMWELDKAYGFWVASEVGGTYIYGDTGLCIDMDNIIYVVNNNVSRREYMEWLDYCVWCGGYEFASPTLKSWMSGCPRIGVEVQNRLDSMKNELDKLISETKEQF